MPLAAVLAIDELGADSSQQVAGEWESGHFLLDYESKTGGECGGQNDSIQIACVVRDDDTGTVGKFAAH